MTSYDNCISVSLASSQAHERPAPRGRWMLRLTRVLGSHFIPNLLHGKGRTGGMNHQILHTFPPSSSQPFHGQWMQLNLLASMRCKSQHTEPTDYVFWTLDTDKHLILTTNQEVYPSYDTCVIHGQTKVERG